MRISIFGGSYPKPGTDAYTQAYELGHLLAMAGHTILTGGYIGTMEAVSRGAAEAGGHVIGVTCEQIEAWRPVRPNEWVAEERRFTTLWERLHELVHACNAAIALPGGPGTLTEISLAWNLMIVGDIPPRPLILVGDGWRSVIESFYNAFDAYIPGNQRALLKFAVDTQAAVSLLVKTK